MSTRLFSVTAAAVLSAFLLASQSFAQSSVNYTGNGGQNSIQGSLVVQSGKRVETAGLKVILRNIAAGDLTLITDGTGRFAFKNLVGGNYTITVEGGDYFENTQDSVGIDEVGSSGIGDPTLRALNKIGKTFNVQLYLVPKNPAAVEQAKLVDASVASAPKAARERYEAAMRSLDKKDTAAATAALRDAVGQFPEFFVAWNQLGLVLGRSGDRSGSVDAFRAAVKANPNYTPALLNLGIALSETGDPQGAETYLAASLARDDSQYLGHFYLGLTELKLGRQDIAEQALKRALELSGDKLPKAHYVLGGIYWANKQYAKAAEQLEKYLSADPKAADAEKVRKSIAELRSKT